MRSLGSTAHFSASIKRSPDGSRESARDFKFAKLTTNMAARGLLRKALLPLSLVSCLRYISLIFIFENIHPSGNIKRKKHSFKPLCWNVNEHCDVDVAIGRAGYQSKKQRENTSLLVVFVPFTIYGTFVLLVTLLAPTA